MLTLESIMRSHAGQPNILISREGFPGEMAVHGDGFYTARGTMGARGTGLTVRFKANPHAREGVDFAVEGQIVIWFNKRALRIIPENFNVTLVELVALVESGKLNLQNGDRGVLENLKRRFNLDRVTAELYALKNSPNPEDQRQFNGLSGKILRSENLRYIFSGEALDALIKKVYAEYYAEQFSQKKDDLARMQFLLASGPDVIRLNLMTQEKLRAEILKIKLTPEIITTIFNSIKGQKSSPDSNLQRIVREILNANPEVVRLLTLEQVIDVINCFGDGVVMRGIREGDRLGLIAQAHSQNITVNEALLVAYESKNSTAFVFGLLELKAQDYGRDSLSRFLDQIARTPWIAAADRLLLDLSLASDRYLSTIDGVRRKGHNGVDAFEKEIVRIHTEMAQQSAEWRKMIYDRFFLPDAKTMGDHRHGRIRFPYFLVEFVEFADLPYFLKVLESLSPAEITSFGTTYKNFKMNQFSAQKVYDTFFNDPKYAKIQRTILEFFPEVYRFLTVDDVKRIIANHDWFRFWLAKRLFETYDGQVEHPVLQEVISGLDGEGLVKIKGLIVQKNITLELWFEFILSYEGKVTGNSKSGGQEHLVFGSTFSTVNSEIFQAYLAKNKMTQQNFYEQIILKKMADDKLPNDDFKVIIWLLHNRKSLGFSVDKQAASLFWKQYNRATGLQFLDHYTHPSHVGHGLPQ